MPVRTVSQKFSHLQWKRLFKELWSRPTTTVDFRSSLWQVPYTSDVCLLEDKVQDRGMYLCRNFLRKLCIGSKKWRWFDSVDDLMSSSSTRGSQMPNFEVLDARIASALNKIIHNSHFKRRISLEEQKAQKQDSFLRGRQIAYLIYDHFRVTGANDSVDNYADLFTIVLRNDDIQEFDSKWDGILLSMTKIPPDDILEGIVAIKNTRVWETQDRIGILWPGDSSEENRTWLSQIENDGEKKYRARYTKIRTLAPRTEIMKETPWSRIQGQNSVCKEFLEFVGNGNPTGSVLKETIAVSATISINVQKWHSRILLQILSCSRMREKRREPEVPE